MPGIAVIGDMSTGHGAWPPTPMISSPIKKTKFNGARPGVVDNIECQFAPHSLPNGSSPHPNTGAGQEKDRCVKSGSSKTKIEGYVIARIGDPLYCGDVIAEGSNNSFIE
jgi:uncharacterized Zn-binding protein involved in type VI secretion